MPILDVEIVLRPGETLPPALAADLADRAGAIFGSETGGTWVKLRLLEPSGYAENGVPAPIAVFPVFVSVLKRTLPALAHRREEAALLAAAAAAACNRPVENVHILYQPGAAGRVAFGGKLIV